MRILSVADLHYTLKQWDWLKGAVEGFDLLVLPGDLLDIVSPVALDVQILVVKKYLRRLPETTPVLVTSGNHDGDGRNDAGEQVADWLKNSTGTGIFSDGDSFEQDGVLFTLCPWWDGEESRTAVAELLERDSKKPKEKWIWLYHAPPAGSPLAFDGKREFGDSELSAWIGNYRPDLVIGGHIHQAPFTRNGVWFDRIGTTMVFNAGRQIGPVPTSIEFDLTAGTATWRWMEGSESVCLKTGQRLDP